MSARPRNAERTKAAILDAARRLFAERGIDKTSLRDIATAAGVSHGLIRQYFGTREEMVAAIIQREIDAVMSSQATADAETVLLGLREGMDRFQDFARIILRAELAGIAPEKMLDPGVTTPAMHLARVISGRQSRRGRRPATALDPKFVSAYVNAALFGFAALAPWLTASVGLSRGRYDREREEIGTISRALIDLACGAPSRKTRPSKRSSALRRRDRS